MKEIIITNKKEYLKENYPFEELPELDEKRRCIHCDREFYVRDYKVFRDTEAGSEYICCPFAPECNGTVIDWFNIE